MALEKIGTAIDVSRYLKKDESGQVVSAQEKNRYVSTPEQLRALQICQELNDEAHKIYYLSLCKRLKPEIIDEALSFISDAQARSKAKLFMWKIKQITGAWRAQGREPTRPLPPAKKKKRVAKTAGEQESLF